MNKKQTLQPFWETKELSELNSEEWESLCDKCGLCCLLKVEDEDTGEVFITNAICSGYDLEAGECSCYKDRKIVNEKCVKIKPDNVEKFWWLPRSCSYRLLYENQPLSENHPLIKGTSSNFPNVVKLFGKDNLIVEFPSIDLLKHIVLDEGYELYDSIIVD